MSAGNASAGNASAAALGLGGVTVPVIFGFVFLLAGTSPLQTRWQVPLRIVAIAAGLLLSWGVAVTRRRERMSQSGARAPLSRRFWLASAAEVIAILAGVEVINLTGRHVLTLTWVVLVVGAHFFGFVGMWNRGRFYAIVGLVMTALGVLGFVLYAAGDTGKAAVMALPAIGAGLTLYAAAGVTLLTRPRALRAHPADRRLVRGLPDRAATKRCREIRTINLGSCMVRAGMRADLPWVVSASDREAPLITGVNGTLMARRPSLDLRFLAHAVQACHRWVMSRTTTGCCAQS